MGTKGIVASTAALAVLLQEGIGDTIRISLTPEPGGSRTQEVLVAQEYRPGIPAHCTCRSVGRRGSASVASGSRTKTRRTAHSSWRRRRPNRRKPNRRRPNQPVKPANNRRHQGLAGPRCFRCMQNSPITRTHARAVAAAGSGRGSGLHRLSGGRSAVGSPARPLAVALSRMRHCRPARRPTSGRLRHRVHRRLHHRGKAIMILGDRRQLRQQERGIADRHLSSSDERGVTSIDERQ